MPSSSATFERGIFGMPLTLLWSASQILTVTCVLFLFLMFPCWMTCFTKSMKNLTIRLIHLYIPFIETFSSPLVLRRNNCNKFQIKNHAPPKWNFPHILFGASTDFDFLCIQQAMLNTGCDNVLLAKHHFLWAEVAYLSCVQQLITFQDKNLHTHTMWTQKYFVHRVLQIREIKV
jgi:hypothetical protein